MARRCPEHTACRALALRSRRISYKYMDALRSETVICSTLLRYTLKSCQVNYFVPRSSLQTRPDLFYKSLLTALRHSHRCQKLVASFHHLENLIMGSVRQAKADFQVVFRTRIKAWLRYCAISNCRDRTPREFANIIASRVGGDCRWPCASAIPACA